MLTMRPWLLSIALGIALFNAPPAQADVPQQIIEQIADFRVQEEELKHLRNIGKLTNGDVFAKTQVIEARIKALWLPYRALSPTEDAAARTAIDRLVADKVSLLRPQWTQEESAVKAARDQRNKQLSAEAEDDARAAAELQRQRVVLQKQLAAGMLTRDAFTAQDKQASDGIAAFRKKYDDAGGEWPHLFDQRYRVMLEAALKNPDTPLPQPSVAAASPAVTAAPPAVANSLPITAPVPPTGSGLAADQNTLPVAAPVSPNVEIPEYLKQMPEPDRVIADIRGSDELDTAARQVAALNRLKDVVVVLSGTSNAPGGVRLTTEELALNGRYSGAASSLFTAVYRSIDPDDKQRSDENSKRNQWNRLRDRYYNDNAFIGALLQRYLTPDLKEKYLGHTQQVRQNIQAPPAPQKVAPIQRTASPGAVISALVGLVIFIGAIVLAIWWLWQRRDWVEQQRRSSNPKRQARVRAALVTFLALAALIVLIALLGAAWVTGLGALALGIWWLWGRKARRLSRIERERRINNQNALSRFGATKEERSKNIDSVFDKKAADVEFDLNERGIRCNFFRSISAMSPREREVLRSAYHLYNLALVYSETNFFLIRFALTYADGKAVITGQSKYRKYSDINSISEALKWYQGGDGIEAMTNLTLNWLQYATKNNQDNPILRKLSSRLHGDGGDLVPGAPLKSAAKGAIEAGLILGLDEKASDTWWYYDGEGSLITVAPPGSGKTQCQVFPNLLMWKGAAVVLDVKGEIYEQTSKWRRENVGPVYKFSPLDPATSHGYNPLAEVRADPDYLWEDARFLADMMIVPSGAKDPFWESRARDVLTAAIARVCLAEDIAKRSMEDVLNILHGVGWDKFVTYLEARVDFPSMTRAGHSLSNMEPKTRDGVLQSALSSMSAWDGERIARATRKSDWSPLDLRSGTNPTIYICLKPNEVDSYISVLRVFIAQHIRSLTSTQVPAHGVRPILFILDELPRLRHMPPVEEALEIGRQYGIKLWLFAQSLGQLKEAYPNADGMIGGCAIRMFMNPSLHDETAQKVSDDIGFMDSVIDGTRVKIVEPNVLAGPDYKDLVIVMAANARAARLKKYFAYTDDELNARMGTLRLAESLPA